MLWGIQSSFTTRTFAATWLLDHLFSQIAGSGLASTALINLDKLYNGIALSAGTARSWEVQSNVTHLVGRIIELSKVFYMGGSKG